MIEYNWWDDRTVDQTENSELEDFMDYCSNCQYRNDPDLNWCLNHCPVYPFPVSIED